MVVFYNVIIYSVSSGKESELRSIFLSNCLFLSYFINACVSFKEFKGVSHNVVNVDYLLALWFIDFVFSFKSNHAELLAFALTLLFSYLLLMTFSYLLLIYFCFALMYLLLTESFPIKDVAANCFFNN